MHFVASFKRWLHAPSIFRPHRLGIAQSCVISAIAGVSATLLAKGVDALNVLRFTVLEQLQHYAGTSAVFHMLAEHRLFLAIFGFAGAFVAGYLVQTFGPDATGSGIPQVKAALERVRVALNFKTALVKLIGGTVVLGSGLLMGREGPTVFVSAALAAEINRLVPTTPAQRKQLIAAGAGAGLAAAFHAPIAGVMFVLEELLKDISSATIGVAVLSCFVASVIATTLDPVGDYADLQQAGVLAHFHAENILFYVLIGIVCGVVGAAFNRCVIGLLDVFKKIPVSFAAKCGAAGLLTGLLLCLLPPDFAYYNDLRQKLILHKSSLETGVLAFGAFFILPVIAYASGAPGGLFAPSLSIGSAIGFVISVVFNLTPNGSQEAFALAGMGGMFASVARVPVTAIIIIFEMTRSFEMVLPLMMTCIVASMVADRLYADSIYDRLMDWSGIRPKHDSFVKRALNEGTAEKIMSCTVDTLLSSDSVGLALEKVRATHHEHLPVLDEDGALVGIATTADFELLNRSSVDADTKVTQIMTANPMTVEADQPLSDILFMFERYGLTMLPVTKNSNLVGVITRSDLIHTIYAASAEQPADAPPTPANGSPLTDPAVATTAVQITPPEETVV